MLTVAVAKAAGDSETSLGNGFGMEAWVGSSRQLRKVQLFKRNGKDKSPLWERGLPGL